MDKKDDFLRSQACQILYRFGSKAAEFVPRLKEIAQERSLVAPDALKTLSGIVAGTCLEDMNFLQAQWEKHKNWTDPTDDNPDFSYLPDTIKQGEGSNSEPLEDVLNNYHLTVTVDGNLARSSIAAFGRFALVNNEARNALFEGCESTEDSIWMSAQSVVFSFKDLEAERPFLELLVRKQTIVSFMMYHLLDFGDEGRKILGDYQDELLAGLGLSPDDETLKEKAENVTAWLKSFDSHRQK